MRRDKACKVSVFWFEGNAGACCIEQAVKIYVGPWEPMSETFGAPIFIGELQSTERKFGSVVVRGLRSLGSAFKVFYITLDGHGYSRAYLACRSNGEPICATSEQDRLKLSVCRGTSNGWVLDTAKEKPTEFTTEQWRPQMVPVVASIKAMRAR